LGDDDGVDGALQRYVHDNAYRTAVPRDLLAALTPTFPNAEGRPDRVRRAILTGLCAAGEVTASGAISLCSSLYGERLHTSAAAIGWLVSVSR
jgi:hypothetical protein